MWLHGWRVAILRRNGSIERSQTPRTLVQIQKTKQPTTPNELWLLTTRCTTVASPWLLDDVMKNLSPPTHRNKRRSRYQTELRNVLNIHNRIPNNFSAWWPFICILALHRSLSNVECHVHRTWMSHTLPHSVTMSDLSSLYWPHERNEFKKALIKWHGRLGWLTVCCSLIWRPGCLPFQAKVRNYKYAPHIRRWSQKIIT